MKEQNGKLSRDEFISFVKAVLQNLQEDLMRLRQMDFSDIKSL